MYTGGGGVQVCGRRCGSGTQFEFTWQTGIALIFNEGDCPQFDAGDAAVVSRMVVAPFRAKFVDGPPAADAEEYTYPMDEQIGYKFGAWRSANLLLEHYEVGALKESRIPQSMREWKSDVLF
jgi:hypothetical protein